MDKWISVEEELPKFVGKSAGDGRDFAYIGWDGVDIAPLNEYSGYWPHLVTHWMPLPEPPKEK